MRVGIDARELEKAKPTGIARYLINFLNSRVVNESGWEFILFCNQKTQTPIEASYIKKVSIPEYITPLWDQVQLPAYLKKHNVDIFLTPYYKAPLLCKARLVLIINDLIPFRFKGYQNLKNFLYFKGLLKIAIKKADVIVTISEYSKNDIVKVFKISPDKIRVIMLGVDERRFYKMDNLDKKVLSKYGIDESFILYTGNFRPHKNVKTLIEAYYRLPGNLKDKFKLVLVGRKDRDQQNLIRLVGNLGLKDKVIFTGYVNDEELGFIYNSASIFVFPSLYEGFGLPVLEAMACGLPVIAFNVSALSEVVGDSGILLNSYSSEALRRAMEEVLSDEELRKDLIQRALNRARQFSTEKMSQDLLAILKELN
ncbi:MAG: glycosyltransferase family 4 protein [Candidatus Omnitrophica bacterium]|nr:glycosyltransferase family 4 protein [Candidatus Omnitrophota bacterium]